VEIFSNNDVVAGAGLAGRVSQLPSTPQPVRTVGVPRQSPSNTDEARTTGKDRETNNSGNSGQVKSLEQAVRESVEELNDFIRPYVTSLQFSIDKDLDRIVVKIMDGETKEVIKQIPSEDVLTLTKALGKIAGLLVKQEA
jgi:flagellar protein FlaG